MRFFYPSWGWLLLCDFAPYKPIYIDMTKTVDFICEVAHPHE